MMKIDSYQNIMPGTAYRLVQVKFVVLTSPKCGHFVIPTEVTQNASATLQRNFLEIPTCNG